MVCTTEGMWDFAMFACILLPLMRAAVRKGREIEGYAALMSTFCPLAFPNSDEPPPSDHHVNTVPDVVL